MENLTKLAKITTAVLVLAILALFITKAKSAYMLFGFALMLEVTILLTAAALWVFSLLVNKKQIV